LFHAGVEEFSQLRDCDAWRDVTDISEEAKNNLVRNNVRNKNARGIVVA
jgi:hypothetical protein